MLKRLQHHAPSWLEQLPQLPEAVLDRLQQPRELDRAVGSRQQQQHVLRKQRRLRQRKRYGLAIILLIAAVVTAVPAGWQQLAEIPAVAWFMAALGILLAMPAEDGN